jgi:hypothetical protein
MHNEFSWHISQIWGAEPVVAVLSEEREWKSGADVEMASVPARLMPTRLQVIHEMVETEESYVKSMKTLLELFVEPMSRSEETIELIEDARVAVFFR